MAEQATPYQAAAIHRPSLEIPWMRLWEKNERKRSNEDSQTRLFNIDYMNMLEELEFH